MLIRKLILMKILFSRLTLVLPLTVLVIAGCAQPKQYDAALVGFYNLENLFDTINQPNVQDEEFTPAGANHYTSKVYNDRLRKLSQVISELGTDDLAEGIALLGVSEIENRSVLVDLVQMPRLKGRNYQIAHIDGPDERGVDVALLYNPKYFTVKQMESLHVPTEKINSAYGYTRDVLLVSGDLLGEPVHILVNHWPSRRGGEASVPLRALSASVCRQKIDSLIKINAHAKIIVMGDFNDDPVDESVAKVLSAKGAADEIKPGGLYNPFMALHEKGIGTMAYHDVWDLFDQIIFSSAFLDKNQSGLFFGKAKVFKRDFMMQNTGKNKGYPKRAFLGNYYAGGYSDHFPAYVVLRKAVGK